MRVKKDKQPESMIELSKLGFQTHEIYGEIYQEFDRFSITDLREIAKRMCVKSATTVNKHTLVDAMTNMKIASTVYYPPEKKPTGPVTLLEVEAVTSDYLRQNNILEAERKKGILDICDEGAWLRPSIFRTDDDIFVPMLMVNELQLVHGDELEGMTRYMPKSGRYAMFKLLKVNRQEIQTFKRQKLTMDGYIDSKILRFERGSSTLNAVMAAAPICLGQRKLIVGLDSYKTEELACEISQKLSNAGIETINIFLDSPPEGRAAINELDGKTVVFDCDQFESYDEAVLLCTQHASMAAPFYRDIAIILNNAEAVSEYTLRKLFSVGQSATNGSITIIIFSSGLELNPTINKLSRSASSVVVLSNGFGYDTKIDIKRSFSDCEKQLDLARRMTVNECRQLRPERFIDSGEYCSLFDILLENNRHKIKNSQ